MPGKLNTFVHVVERDRDGNQTNAGVFGPGDDLPDWAVAAIENPDVWDGDPPDRLSDDSEREADRNAADSRALVAERPRGNASRDAWADYARSQQVEVSDDMDRAAIIAAVDKK